MRVVVPERAVVGDRGRDLWCPSSPWRQTPSAPVILAPG